MASRLPFPEAARRLLRETVLDVMDEVVREHGWAATTMKHIAEATGVSRQTIYNEFGSRQSIADAYIERRTDAIVGAAAELIRSRPGDFPGAIRDAVTLFLDMVDEPLVQTVLEPGRLGPELVAAIKTLNARAVGPLAEAVTDAHPELAPDDATALVDTIAQVAAAHVAFPVHTRDVTIDRLTRVARLAIAAAGEETPRQ